MEVPTVSKMIMRAPKKTKHLLPKGVVITSQQQDKIWRSELEENKLKNETFIEVCLSYQQQRHAREAAQTAYNESGAGKRRDIPNIVTPSAVIKEVCGAKSIPLNLRPGASTAAQYYRENRCGEPVGKPGPKGIIDPDLIEAKKIQLAQLAGEEVPPPLILGFLTGISSHRDIV